MTVFYIDPQKLNVLSIYFFFTFFLLLHVSIYGQISSEARYEVIAPPLQDFNVIVTPQHNIVLIHKKGSIQNGVQPWEIILLNDSLQIEWSKSILVSSSYLLKGYDASIDGIAFFFVMQDNITKEFLVAQTNYTKKKPIRLYPINHKSNIDITHFYIVGDNFLLGGYIKEKPTVLLYKSNSNKLKIIPDLFIKSGKLLNIQVIQNKLFNIIYEVENSFKKKYLVTKIYSSSGAMLYKSSIAIKANVRILSTVSSHLKRDQLMISGTYGVSNKANKKAIGIYIAQISPSNTSALKYYAFGQLEHFFDYMNSKKSARIKERTKQRMETGKMPLYTTFAHPIRIEENTSGFFLALENYQTSTIEGTHHPYLFDSQREMKAIPPQYYIEQNPNTKNLTKEEYVKYIQTVVIMFDEQGTLVWDASLPIEDLTLSSVKQVSAFAIHINKMCLIYRNENYLNVALKPLWKDTLRIANKLKMETLIPRTFSSENLNQVNIRYWYNNFFCTWGYQEIRKTKSLHNKTFFYINKLKY